MSLLSRLFGRGSRPHQPPKAEAGLPVAYAEWSCLNDDDSCDACKILDGLAWIPSLVRVPEPPLGGCTSREGCRCTPVFIMKESAGALETANFVQRLGGRAEASQVRAFWEKKRAPLLKKRTMQGLANGKSQEASGLEKSDPTQAIALYRESIQLVFDAAGAHPEHWDLNSLPHLFNRLTLVLERSGDAEAALVELSRYEGLDCSEFATAAQREALTKRRVRLLKRISRPSDRTSRT